MGDPDAALSRIGDDSHPHPPFAHEQVCRARALLARGDLHQAEAVLAQLRSGRFDRSAVVDAWLLTALVADRLREDNRAVDALGRALKMARPDRIRRPFLVQETEQLSRLLSRVHHLDPGASEFAHELLADMGPTPTSGVRHGVPAEPLTDRESSVLRYLSTMMTNAEIASELYVSVNTIKVHLKHIYRKLGVVSRRQAVHRARDLGLLTE